jgi:hypothetical protein
MIGLFVVLGASLLLARSKAQLPPVCQHRTVTVEACDEEKEIFIECYQTSLRKDGTTKFENVAYDVSPNLVNGGQLHQLSNSYAKYGYSPRLGERIEGPNTVITGPSGRLFYSRPCPDTPSEEAYGTITFQATGVSGLISNLANITLVPPSGKIIGSNFLFGNEGWEITGNKLPRTDALYTPFSVSASSSIPFNRYIYGTDDLITLGATGDTSLWGFISAARYSANLGISYGGRLGYSLMTFTGDFSSENLNSRTVSIIV